MFMKRIITIVAVSAFVLGGCGIDANPMLAAYDNDELIASTSNSYNLIGFTQVIDGQSYVGSVEKIEGMDTVWTYDADNDTSVSIEYLLSVESGKAKLVLISPDGTLSTIVEVTSEAGMDEAVSESLSVVKGKNRIKLVAGENTKADLELSISEGTLHNLGF